MDGKSIGRSSRLALNTSRPPCTRFDAGVRLEGGGREGHWASSSMRSPKGNILSLIILNLSVRALARFPIVLRDTALFLFIRS